MAERVVERTLSDGGLSIHYRLERLGIDHFFATVVGGEVEWDAGLGMGGAA